MKLSRALALAAALLLIAQVACADMPYYTLTMGAEGELVETQCAYEPVRMMVSFGGETLKKPSDMALGPDGNLYIADTGNKRVLVVTQMGELVRIIGDDKELASPTGVFVDQALNVYVADERKGYVVRYDAEGRLAQTWERPTHPMFGEGMAFKPSKVAVDSRGTLYITSAGNYNGIIKLGADGSFIGYFGANTARVSVTTMLKKLLYSDEQFAQSVPNIIPLSIQSLCMDDKGMVYTVSQTTGAQALRRLNVAGNDNLTPEYVVENPVCVAVTDSGSIIAANASGEIMEMTGEGRLLFLTSAVMRSSLRKGLFQGISAVAVTDDYRIFVLDRMVCNVQVLTPTEFADTVHGAFDLFQHGRYLESKALWTEAKRMNGFFSYASVGLGEAQFREGEYRAAMESFRHGSDKAGYSDAFWEVRADWLHEHLVTVLLWAAGAMALVGTLLLVQKKTYVFEPLLMLCDRFAALRLVREVRYAFGILRHPYDVCYGVKREGKASLLSGTVLLLLFFAAYVVQKYYSGFLFSSVRSGVYELALDAETVALVFGLVTMCCYLVSSIKDGEARWTDTYIAFAYSLIPVVILCPIATLLSNVLTLNETFVISLLHVIAYGWSGLLFVLSIMFLNDYSLRKTLTVILWSLFTIVVVVAVVFIFIVFLNQLLDFLRSVYGEGVYRFASKA